MVDETKDNSMEVLDLGEGIQISLSDLAGINLSEVDEVRGSQFPQGIFVFEIMSDPAPILEVIEVADRDSNVPNAKKKAAVARFSMKCIDVKKMPDMQIDGTNSPKAEDVINRQYNETFFIREGAKDVGRIKAFLVDVGVTANGSLQDVMMAAIGKKFVGVITHRFSKDNKDVIYVNLNRNAGKIVPLAA